MTPWKHIKEICGTGLTWVFAGVGHFTLSDFASTMAIVVSFATLAQIIHNWNKGPKE